MVAQLGMSDQFGMTALETVNNRYLSGDASLVCSNETATLIDKEVMAIIKNAHAEARKILEDNAQECRDRLFEIVESEARRATKNPDEAFLDAVRYLLNKNVLCGDALTLKDSNGNPITFAEWSLVTGDKVKRRDFLLSELLDGNTNMGETLSLFSFDEANEGGIRTHTDWEYDSEIDAYIPSAIKEYPLTNYWEVQRYE